MSKCKEGENVPLNVITRGDDDSLEDQPEHDDDELVVSPRAAQVQVRHKTSKSPRSQKKLQETFNLKKWIAKTFYKYEDTTDGVSCKLLAADDYGEIIFEGGKTAKVNIISSLP